MAKKPVLYGQISSGYGYRVLDGSKQFHPGIDIISPHEKAIVCAAYSGTLMVFGFSDSYGNRVWIKNDVGYFSIYGHMDSINHTLKDSQKIHEGDFLGIMGNTGLIYYKGKLVHNKYENGSLIIPLPAAKHLHYGLMEGMEPGAKSIEPVELINLHKS